MHFFEYGKPDGVPLVFLLGTPHAGDSVAELSDLAADHGIRLICTTRCWYVDAAATPSFDRCTAQVMAYLDTHRIGHAFALGGSGGGPFALHLASNHPTVFRACHLLASMGDPVVFARTVASPHTRALLSLFASHDRESALARLEQWGIPLAQGRGVWADFQVLLGSWAAIALDSRVPVRIHHGADDDNAPLESITALAAQLADCQIALSPDASHLGLANDPHCNAFVTIFQQVAAQAALALPAGL